MQLPTGVQSVDVRQHERVRCDAAVAVAVGPGSAERVALSRAAAGGDGAVSARAVDVSPGGIGLVSPVYFPPGCELCVRVEGSAEVGVGEGGRGGVLVRVRRVAMVGPEPQYDIGTAFEAPQSASASAARRALGLLWPAGPQAGGGGSGQKKEAGGAGVL